MFIVIKIINIKYIFIKNGKIEEMIPKNNYNPFEGNEYNNNLNLKEEDKSIRDIQMKENNILNNMLKNEESINK